MSEQKYYLRFEVARRIEHLVLVASFTLLALTGLPQKFPLSGISQGLIAAFGGIESIRIVHRVCATIFLLEAIYHLAVLGYKLYVQRLSASMGLGLQDAKEALQALLYNLGRAKEPPRMGRYNFAEKAEYWAMVWGLAIMALTGFMLWNPIVTSRALPGVFIPAAKTAHGAEAILAVLAIILWHFYNVHLKKWNWSMINGKLSRGEMEEEHALELEQIEAGLHKSRASQEEQQKRLKVYVPVVSILSLVLLFGVFRFVTFEDTAIKTVPPAETNVEIYVPLTPTPEAVAETPSAAGGEAATWKSSVGAMFDEQCKMCHGSSGGLSVASYADLMKGGSNGPVILAGDPDNSLLIKLQESGTHPGQFSSSQLEQIKEWIKAGAPE